MTSDAKIGLLLGLIFIFAIAFLINGLPSFHKETNNNELTTNMVSFQNNADGIGSKERKASREVINRKDADSGRQIQAIRFSTALPKATSSVEQRSVIEPVIAAQFLSGVKNKRSGKVKASKAGLPKVYVVRAGESLAVIAKKFYGDQEGNRKINIKRIFKANRRALSSADEIYEGQKLLIPRLSSSTSDKNNADSVLSAGEFAKVKSIGRRYRSTSSRTEQSGWYVVREGDSLWRIAAEQLGSAERYSELAKLNTDILGHEDDLVVGTRLKLPGR